MAKSKKTFVNTEIVDQEQEKMAHGKTWAVKIKEWKNGFLIKVLDKKLFKKVLKRSFGCQHLTIQKKLNVYYY